MGKIIVLDDSVSSKIAAGEIIERPASVVKELVENSIDAGSRHIQIEIEKGGKKLIRIIDDGEGISKDDIKPAFERHATSKIHNLADIFNIKTLGFRGEALPSIACVADVTLLTKTSSESVGTRCEIQGGVIKQIEEAPARKGCLFEVRNLFYNTPARLKFLGSDTQETSHIVDFIIRISMGNPDISFRLISSGSEIFFSSGSGDFREVIARVYGKNVAEQMIEIEKSFDKGIIRGFISAPQFNRGNRTAETFFVNRRWIKNKNLSFILERAYKTLLPVSRFPMAVIMIEVDNSQIDVNVHPAKLEIKFQNENEVHKSLYEAAVEGLKASILMPKETFVNTKVSEDNVQVKKSEPKIIEEQSTLMLEDEGRPGKIIPKSVYFPNKYDTIKKGPALSVNENKERQPYAEDNRKLKIKKIIGQLFNTYIVAEGEGEFYLIDQHAAHERVLFERYLNKYNERPASQGLVQPHALKISVQDMAFIEEYSEDIKNMGFDFSLFGKDTVLIRSVPYFFDKALNPEILGEVLDRFRGEEYIVLHPREKFIASMACHTAIKAGYILNSAQINELICQLKRSDNPFTCPHGRPTIIAMSLYELEKKFKRIM